jgi:hypothetical protein
MTTVVESFGDLLPIKRRPTRKGIVSFNCPACGDRRGRGAFFETPTGGFRFWCFNSGCDFEKPTGYEPGSAFGARTRRLFELLGGDPDKLQWDEIRRHRPSGIDLVRPAAPATRLPEVELPPESMLLHDATDPRARPVQDYLNHLLRGHLDEKLFAWTPQYPEHFIIPWFDDSRIVGWIGEHIGKKQGELGRFIYPQTRPSDFVFRPYGWEDDCRRIYVTQGELEAVLLGFVSTCRPTITSGQIAWLRRTGKEIVLVPEDHSEEFERIGAQEHWRVGRVPEIPGGHASIRESYMQLGVLYTIQYIGETALDGHREARLILAAPEERARRLHWNASSSRGD